MASNHQQAGRSQPANTMHPEISLSPIPLSASLDFAAADELYRSITTRLNDGDIVLDGAAVERVGTPCLQVLAAAFATAQQRQRSFRLQHASAVLQSAIADLALAAAIPLEV